NIVTYDAMLEDWRSLAVQSAGRLGVTWPKAPSDASAEIRAYLSQDLHHQRATKEELDVDATAPAWVKAAYNALIRLCDEPKSGRAKRELDLIRYQFNESCKLFGDVAYADRQRAREAVRDMMAAEARAASSDALRAELDRTLASSEAREQALAVL